MSTNKKEEKDVKRLDAICIPCPDPFILEINSNQPYHLPGDFSSNQLANGHNQFNSNQHDRPFLHTYRWKPKDKCCQVLKAHIQVKFTAIIKGRTNHSPDAGNDNFQITGNGGTDNIYSSRVYAPDDLPISPGESVIKNYVLTGSQLNWLNTNHSLSFRVQDDTAVNWIRIRLEICCLKKRIKPTEIKE